MLTDTLIRKINTPAKPTKLSDERGLYLLCVPTGGKWWRFKYRFAGKEKLLSLGTYPDVSLKKAREARDEARKQLAAGADPSATRRQERQATREAFANDFESVAREWLENVRPAWAAVYHGDTTKRFEAFVFPSIGSKPVAQVTGATLLPLLRKIEARGTLVTAHKVLRACGQVFRYGIATGRCERNPASDLRGALRALPRPKHMAALPAVELPTFLRKIEGYDGDVQTKLALRLLALTFVRTSELREARWEEIDFDKGNGRSRPNA
jgi:hypothetical protein